MWKDREVLVLSLDKQWSMQHNFDIIKQTRANFLKAISGLGIEDVNQIPRGFNNNIIWNLGHIVASQQVLCYKLAGLEPEIDPVFLPKYGRGSRPETPVSSEEFETLKALAVSKAEDLENHYKHGHFKTYNEYTTSYGVKLTAIEDAIRFVAVHEGLHFGYAMALKRALLISQ